MGEARRRRLALIKGGKADEARQPALTQPPAQLTTLTIQVPRSVAAAINGLHQFVAKHYPHRNEFLEDLLKEGLKSALQAQQEALAQLQAAQHPIEAPPTPEPLVRLTSTHEIPRGGGESELLRRLRGES